MKFVCSQSDLNNNLSLVSRVVPSRPEPPVLGNVLLVAKADTQKVSLTGFDGSLGISTSFNAEIIEEGAITLPAKLLNDIVSRLPEMEITLSVPEKDDDSENRAIVANLSSPSGKFELRGIEGSEFPELPVVSQGEAIALPVSLLLEGLRGCLFAASTELSKQILTGIHVKTQTQNSIPDNLEFAATDSHRLAVVETSIEKLDEESVEPLNLKNFAVTIPARALRELEKILATLPSSETVQLRFDDTQVIFELDDRCLTSLRLLGTYPAYEQLIPLQFARQMVVDRKRLVTSLELVAVLAQKNNIVKFSLDSKAGQLLLAVDAQDIGSAKESLPAEIIGEDIDIAFNIKYLMDGLKAMSATEIKMQLNEWNQPVIFTPLSGVKMTYLVMPVQIRN
ncbi:DNA polymerase III subunit beta [Pleurocapsales cyanobacterium LEGE 06147]|nr:DNA polymerase III subunit beta [Pleurocapsales cyanobacterium LEGE 06147]